MPDSPCKIMISSTARDLPAERREAEARPADL
jgi:hypothetical protein